MRRQPVLPSLLLLVATLVAGGISAGRLVAQDTPPIPGIELAPGVVAEVFAGVPSVRATGQTLYVARLTFQPGSDIFPHSHPGTVLFAVESGTFGWTLVEGSAQVVRGAAAGGTETEAVSAAGTEVILTAGDAIYYEDEVVHTARNAGDDPAVVLVGFILESGQPLLMPAGTPMPGMEMEGTPQA